MEIDKEQYENLLQEVKFLKNSLEYKIGDAVTLPTTTSFSGFVTNNKKDITFTVF